MRKRIGVFGVVNGIILTGFAVLCLYPFLNQVLLSFASPADFYNSGLLIIPKHFNLESYKYILYQGRVGNAFLVSLGVTVVGTVWNMALTIIGSFALSRPNMPGKKFLFVFILITMFFGGGLIPFYITVDRLGLINSPLSLILPFSINSFNMIILRNFFSNVPTSVIESAKIDGANQFRLLWQFVIPLSYAGIATIGLFYLVERWNDWYWPMLFITDSAWFPLSLELRNILSQAQSSGIGGGTVDPGLMFREGQQSATIVLAILPILIAYPFVQKYFVKGVMLGAVKE